MMSPQQASAQTPTVIDGTMLREVCAHFATGVTVITSGAAGESVGITVNSFTSVSLAPPLVLFCLHEGSRLRPVVQQAGGFVVNFLTYEQQPLARAFARRESARIQDVPHHCSGAGLPVLTESLAYLACRLVDEYRGGDHTIVLGEVVELGVHGHDKDPLVFYRGAMRPLDNAFAV